MDDSSDHPDSVVGWFLGHFGGSLVHLLLVIALIVLIIQLVTGRRAV